MTRPTTGTSTPIAKRPPLTGDTRYTAHGKAIIFVVAGLKAEPRLQINRQHGRR